LRVRGSTLRIDRLAQTVNRSDRVPPKIYFQTYHYPNG
jgi:hypothetical protein